METLVLVCICSGHSVETQEWKIHQGDSIIVWLTHIINPVRLSERQLEDRRLLLLEKRETSRSTVATGVLHPT